MKLSKALSCLRYFSKLIFHRISSAVSISLAFSEVQQIITSSALLSSILLLISLYKMLLKLVSFIRKSNFVITINDIFVIVGGISVQSSEFRVQFKLLLFVYKSLHNQSPSYITDLLSVKTAANYALRSSAKSLLFVPKVNCSTLGDRAFAHAAPVL